MRKVHVEALDGVRRRLTVEVPESEVGVELERAYARLRGQARVRGFRQGRAPRALLERMFGDQVQADAFAKLIQETSVEALAEQNITPLGQPEVVTEQAQPGLPLRYSLTVEVRPDVVAKGYSGLEVVRRQERVSEEDVDRSLRELQEGLAQLRPIEDRRDARPGDIAIFDYEAWQGNRLLSRAEDRLVEVTEGDSSSTSVAERLSGTEVGDKLEFHIDYPSDEPDQSLAGRRVSFRVTLKRLATKEVPPLDDEFAKDHGECSTLAELRERVRRNLEERIARQAGVAVRSAVVEQLVQLHDVEVPRALVERRLDILVDDFLESLGPRRPPSSREGELRDKARAQLEARARNQIKAELILEAVARQEQIELSEEEIDRRIDAFAEQAESAERVRALYREPAARAGLRAKILQERALDLVVQRAHIRAAESND